MASPPQHPPATAPLPTATPAHPATASQPLPSAFLATSAPQRAAAASPPPAPQFVFTATSATQRAAAASPPPFVFTATSAPQRAAAASPAPSPQFVFTATSAPQRAATASPPSFIFTATSAPQRAVAASPPPFVFTATSAPQRAAAATPPPAVPFVFTATSAPQRVAAASPPAAAPFVFTGRALHTNPRPASTSHGIIYPVATSSTAAANQRRAPHVAVGYPRANAVALPIAPSQQPQVPTQSRLPAAAPRSVVAGVTPSPRPELPPRGVPIAPQPQPEVNLSDSESGSLYALCRSWVRNGVQHEIQPSFVGNVAPVLPRPLPASVVDSRMSGKDKEAENEEPKEKKNDTGEYTTAELLKELVDRAKKIRAEFRKERQSRIERYKQRLALLLPSTPLPPSEPGTHDRRP
ncbi:hypothetical protein BRADI_1g68918v3 [Brachypodium distachyon]|uniref:Uncharacterized protein n=1 Tax=Brachypodium distachyon TaxID=15368 RepID=A0A0Q3KE35_BRADI|nr:hypothetical protein BRADI_1g68918v3 [Brachypodium distachyon]